MYDDVKIRRGKIYEIVKKNMSPICEDGLDKMTNSLVVLSSDLSSLRRMIDGSEVSGKDMRVTMKADPVDEPFRSVCREVLEYCEKRKK
ncbi:hypothetical protein J4226_03910 [Candidatus Pacearchaeota archaeon]|nr:hypothetical protein [Candidatus Pacearchaeota archaeon]